MTDWDSLKELAKMKTSEDIREFEEQVWGLAQSKDPEVLGKLIDLFDDNCPYEEVMFSLVHAIETYPDEEYVKGVLKKISIGLSHYPDWLQILIFRILNNAKTLMVFRQNLHLASKQDLLNLFSQIEGESPDHQALISELRQELGKLP